MNSSPRCKTDAGYRTKKYGSDCCFLAVVKGRRRENRKINHIFPEANYDRNPYGIAFNLFIGPLPCLFSALPSLFLVGRDHLSRKTFDAT